ncbi:MJ0042 family finger-like domain-containing protein [Ruegeria halocynthiae]|uniref:MJ0042 family finger-like domain-containing protein n=1 Tax=Ruegeria halocynthiae TaxID=985054 RepID=A0A1H2ZBV4_9RHOB|nr:zinc-ribbon domain-containing protein [Ruegeria halocynthiae]SDX14314.1 MJ0042 family finger-like domain-containing protein [Ruegeria halocynthiae]
MRLTCPNCSAQYEVPDEVIPEDGREVQCSNCEKTWFQTKTPVTVEAEPETKPAEAPVEPKEASAEDTPEPEVTDKETEPSEEQVVGNVDPAVSSILKEEAAREAELRDREGSNLESQPDLALDPPEEPQIEPKRPSASETAADAGQKDELPDVEAINSGLRSELTSDETETTAPTRKSGGFLRGFALIIIIGVILFLIYGNANQISEAVPQADAVLKPYVSMVDQARLWLEAQTGN